jgi:hypothetical protein
MVDANFMQEKIDHQVVHNKELTRAIIAEWLRKDIEGIYVLLAEFLREPEIFEKLLDVYWKRYEKLRDQGTLDLTPKNEDNGNVR